MSAAAPGPLTRSRESTHRWLLLAPAMGLIGVFLLCPLAIVVLYSFLTPATYGGVEWIFSVESYVQFLFERDLFDDSLVFSSAYLEIYARSLVQALVATAVCLAVGFPMAYFIATRPPNQRTVWLLLVTVPYWVNLLIRTIAMLFVIRDQGPLNQALVGLGIIETPLRLAYTPLGVAIGLVYSYLPFMILPIYASIEKLDFRLVEAARDLYAHRWTALVTVVLPLVRPGIAAGCLLVFIPSLGSFIAPDLLGGGKELMIGNLIALQFQGSRNWPFGAAAAVILMTVVLGALLLYALQQRSNR